MSSNLEQAAPEQWVWQVGNAWEVRITSAVGARYIALEAYPLYEGNLPDLLLQTRHPLEAAEKFAELLKAYQQRWLAAGLGPTTMESFRLETSPWTAVAVALTPDDLGQIAELVGRAVAHARKLVVVK